MPQPKWLDAYSGQTTDQLLALAPEYRVDSIVLAFEQAVQQRAERTGRSKLNEGELTILAVEALEREVNNGGYHQFFLNTPEHAPAVVKALQRIDCPETAKITALAVSLLGLKERFTAEDVTKAFEKDSSGKLVDILSDRCDQPYQSSGEPIADRLFAFIRTNRSAIRLR